MYIKLYLQLQLIWLILHVGGEPLLDRFLSSAKLRLAKSQSLTTNAKSSMTKCVEFLMEEKPTLKRLHNSLFYIDGRFYNISNRMVGIHYVSTRTIKTLLLIVYTMLLQVLLRQWQQHNYFIKSFKMLGHVSLFYIIFKFVNKFLSNDQSKIYHEQKLSTTTSKKECILCGEFMRSPSATPCGHVFCWVCIYDSLKYQKVCPICRENVNPNRIILLQNYV